MTQNGVRMENVWNVDYGAPVTPIGLALVNNVFDAWITANLASVMHSSVKYDQLVATDISVANGAQDLKVPTTTQGAGVAGEAAGNAAFVASLRTLNTGRNFRGRTYVAGMNQSSLINAQNVSTATAAAYNVVFVNLVNALSTAGYALCVLSRYLNNALRVVGVLTEVISVITNTKIDSQQRRTAN